MELGLFDLRKMEKSICRWLLLKSDVDDNLFDKRYGDCKEEAGGRKVKS